MKEYSWESLPSLGGAVANYLSICADVMKYVQSNKEKIYTYTFESPHTCINLIGSDPESESNAYNFEASGICVRAL